MAEASSEAKNITLANFSGNTQLLGVASGMPTRFAGVSITAFTLIPLNFNSLEKLSIRRMTVFLEAQYVLRLHWPILMHSKQPIDSMYYG